MINKVIIAAAGRGTRMKDLSKDKPKHLIKVCGRPFLYYLLNNLIEAGYKELILVVGYKNNKIKDFLKTFKDKDKVTLVNQFDILGEDKYGTACVLECLHEKVKNESFLMVYGDNLYSIQDLKKFRDLDNGFNYVGGLEHEEPEKYGVLKREDHLLKEIIEKPKQNIGRLINVGLYSFNSDIFDKVKEIQKSERGEYEITDAINLLAKDKKVKIKTIEDYWLDFGNPSDVQKVSSFLEKRKLKIQNK
jgi:bifunctional UDP-N-acetylglucosamine pyrophosphorylase/glucosamine-1-phosphate N-acetyltransferase